MQAITKYVLRSSSNLRLFSTSKRTKIPDHIEVSSHYLDKVETNEDQRPPPRKIRIHYVKHEPKVPDIAAAPTIVLLHGWGDYWYSWRHQVPPLIAQGYRVLTPDLRGCGSVVTNLSVRYAVPFSKRKQCNDIKDILDAEKVHNAIIIGHDFGGSLAWHMAMEHPERVRAVGSLCTPHLAPLLEYTSLKTLAEHDAMAGAEHQRILDWNDAREILGTNVRHTLRWLFRKGDRYLQCDNEPWPEGFRNFDSESDEVRDDSVLSNQELAEYIAAYSDPTRSFVTSLHWFSADLQNWNNFREADHNLSMPSLMVTAEHDLAWPRSLADGMEELCSDLTRAHVQSGHWIHMEQPEEVNSIFSSWLQKVSPKNNI